MKYAAWIAVGLIGLAGWTLGDLRPNRPGYAADGTGDVAATYPPGLLVLYDFSEKDGPFVKDRSGSGDPLDLRIEKLDAVRRSAGRLEVRGKTLIRSEKPAKKILDAVRRSGAISVEVWVEPANTTQNGPARIVTISKNTNERNITLGQDGDRFDFRLRTTKTSGNGMPSISSPPKSAAAKLSHLVYTRDRSGRARVYVNGKQTADQVVAGEMSNWNGDFRLAVANELSDDRPWQGTLHLVALYSRDLAADEVERHFRAGPSLKPVPLTAEQLARRARREFDANIGPLLATHCLECHDTATKQGGLDLSRKAAALAGGESGKALVPGKPSDSLLWELVAADDMPKDRAPLSEAEKQALRKWIDRGAAWPVEVIDPAVYVHARKSENWIRRLTVPEYIETVRSAVGVDIEADARRLLPPDLRADGFSNTAYNLNVDLKHVEAYSELAEIIVGRMDVVSFAAKFSRSRKLTDDNMRALIAQMGKWLLRAPLEDDEIVVYRGISTTAAAAGGDFKEAVGYVIEAMLQSPRFIYRVEQQVADEEPRPVGSYELASRLSYILWGAPPDEELLRAAENGALREREQIEQQVQRMLRDPRVTARSSQFLSEWLNLGRLANLNPNAEHFPRWSAQLAADMREETLAFFKEVAWTQNRPLADLLNAQLTFATPRLAEFYGLESRGEGLQRYDLSSVPGRGGLLTQGSVLTVGGDEASMVTRGLFVLHELLRGTVNDPPPCVDTTPVPTKAGVTQRSIAEARIANVACGGCHTRFEPLAFGLEKFDGLGAYHERDSHGNRLRDDGEILFPGDAAPVRYQSSAELMNLLAKSDRVQQTLTWKVTQFALGRPLVPADVPAVEQIHAESQKLGGTYAALIKAIVLSDLVLKTRGTH